MNMHMSSALNGLHALVGADVQVPYDMRDVLAEVVDDRYVFEMIPDYARNVISGFARLGGETVGIIANNPLVLAGVLDMDAAIKASRWDLVMLMVLLSRHLSQPQLALLSNIPLSLTPPHEHGVALPPYVSMCLIIIRCYTGTPCSSLHLLLGFSPQWLQLKPDVWAKHQVHDRQLNAWL